MLHRKYIVLSNRKKKHIVLIRLVLAVATNHLTMHLTRTTIVFRIVGLSTKVYSCVMVLRLAREMFAHLAASGKTQRILFGSSFKLI